MGNLFDILLVPLGYVIRFAYSITHSYLASILIFALIIEIILSPLQIKQQKSSIKQARLQPKVNAIRKKYAGRTDNVSKQKMQQETMDLYREEGFNPAGGCLPLLIQLPVVLCVWRIITQPLKYISRVPDGILTKLSTAVSTLGTRLGENVKTYPEMGMSKWLTDGQSSQFVQHFLRTNPDFKLSEYNLAEFKLFGLDLSPNPSFTSWLIIIPILVFAAMWGSMVIMKKFTYQAPEAEEAQNKLSMRIMNLAMPALSTWFCFKMPAIVGVYWIFRNVLSVGERFVISKIFPIPKMSEEDVKKAEKEYGGKLKEQEANKPPVRSLHRIDWDDDELPPPVPEDEEEDEEEEKTADVPASEENKGRLYRVPMKDDVKEDRESKKKEKKEKKNKKDKE